MLRRRIAHALDRRFRALDGRIDALDGTLGRLEAELRWLVQDPRGNRERLLAARANPAYAAVYEDPAPLVSVLIPTYDNTELLLERSLPSVLAQTYERLEVLVVGDAVPEAVGDAVRAVGDPRLRFHNLGYRLRHPDRRTEWMIGSVSARNAGLELATGAWLVDFDDDDQLRPRAIESGLALALEERLEVAYGPFVYHWPDGRDELMAEFPPRFQRFGLQGAVTHGALRFFERNRAAAVFGVPQDWFKAESMLQAGVRFGMHDEVVFDYYPSQRGAD